MAAACGNLDHTAGGDLLHSSVHNRSAPAGDNRPHLVPVPMAVVIHAVAGIQRHLDCQRARLHIDHFKAAPRLFRKHNLLLEFVDKGLYVAGLRLVADKNALRRCRDHHIMQTYSQDRHVHLIDDMHAGALIIQLCLADHSFIHCLS